MSLHGSRTVVSVLELETRIGGGASIFLHGSAVAVSVPHERRISPDSVEAAGVDVVVAAYDTAAGPLQSG